MGKLWWRIANQPRSMLRAGLPGDCELPAFIVIGGQKCGTTSLYQYLVQHPQILRARTKEVNYFHDPVKLEKGLNGYRSNFPHKLEVFLKSKLIGKPVISGEASPCYLFYPQVAARISEVHPVAKLIVLLRNPTARAYSHYAHNLRDNREPLSFEEAILQEDNRLNGVVDEVARNGYYNDTYSQRSYKLRGMYVTQLERFFEYFDRESMLILKSEDLFNDPLKVVTTIYQFLGLEPFQPNNMANKNPGNYLVARNSMQGYLDEYFEEPNERLRELLNWESTW